MEFAPQVTGVEGASDEQHEYWGHLKYQHQNQLGISIGDAPAKL